MIHVHLPTDLTLAAFAAVGVVVGLVLLVRGFSGYRAARRISGTSTSRISALAVGEVLVSGTAEPLELTLVSPLQSAACLYYRSRVREASDGDGRDIFAEERAVGFRVRDASGAVRVFPRGARFDVPNLFDGTSGSWDGDPPGLMPRVGSAFGPGPDRESQIAALLTVRDPGGDPWGHYRLAGAPTVLSNSPSILAAGSGRRHYEEARIDAGEVVTVIGQVLPFSELDDPASANVLDGSAGPASDPEIAADLAEAREAGILADSPAEAWGNAAIEGFGIGQPVRAPELDPGATPPPSPDPGLAARAAATFDIAPGDLVIAASDEVPLIVSLGAPGTAAARHQVQFVIGLLGAVLAIASAMAMALLLDATPR
jgi:hypothetical protein